jgi:hypothetical protein
MAAETLNPPEGGGDDVTRLLADIRHAAAAMTVSPATLAARLLRLVLEDAAAAAPVELSEPGAMTMWFMIHYVRDEFFDDFGRGEKLPTIKHLDQTHTLVADLNWEAESGNLEQIYDYMQAENWLAEYEDHSITKRAHGHTSMTVGDVIRYEDQYWVVAPRGFVELKE